MEIVRKIAKDYRIPLLALLVFVFMSLTNPYFFKQANLFGLFDSMPAYGIAAVGLTFIMLCGQLDISMGSVMALSSCVFMMTLNSIGFIPSMLLALAIGCVLGAVTGFFVAFFRLSPFIVSMTTQIAYKGIALTITNSTPVVNMHPVLVKISEIKVFGAIPITFFVFVLVALLAEFVMTKTQYGRNLFVIGGNINVADNLGLNVRGHLWSVYVIQGFCAALGGIVMMTRMFSASGNLALDGPLSIIPMVIVGGTAFAGGKGGAIKTLFGVLLMNIIFNALSMFNIYVNIQQLIKGVILLMIIVSDKYLENRHNKV
ncbi:MAG TPA: ABC transporter permease [Clostridiaceae bacterium]|nr:ABC transporter permease [Clostridiaceae bacterium]